MHRGVIQIAYDDETDNLSIDGLIEPGTPDDSIVHDIIQFLVDSVDIVNVDGNTAIFIDCPTDKETIN